MQHNRIVTPEEWLEARKALLVHEKEATHLRDKVNAERLALPWVRVDKDYAFDTPAGRNWLVNQVDESGGVVITLPLPSFRIPPSVMNFT